MIHPSAIIHPNASLGKNISVSPFCVIGEKVTLGDNCVLHPHVTITGRTTCGEGNTFHPQAIIGGAAQEKIESGDDTSLIIGDRNTFRECSTAHVGTLKDNGVTTIGSDNLFMAYSHIAHDSIIDDHVIFSNNATVAGHVRVKSWAILSGGASVHQFGMIGEHAFVGGHSGAIKDVPPFIMAMGTPAKPFAYNAEGMKRRGFSTEEIKEVKLIYKTLYRSNLSFSDARDSIDKMAETSHIAKTVSTFLSQTTRGIIR